MDDDRELLLKIHRNVDAVRSELAALRSDLERAGLIGALRDENKVSPPTWTPPILNRLGDMVKIVAHSNVATAIGRTDTAPKSGLDKPDPMVDPPNAPGKDNDPTRADPTEEDRGDKDPTPKDEDGKDGMNAKDPGDNDPRPEDPDDPTTADKKFHQKDDDDDEQHHKDGKLDNVDA